MNRPAATGFQSSLNPCLEGGAITSFSAARTGRCPPASLYRGPATSSASNAIPKPARNTHAAALSPNPNAGATPEASLIP